MLKAVSIISVPSPSSFWITVRSAGTFNVTCSFVALWAFVKILKFLRRRFKTTQLRGPPRTSFIYGVSHDLASSNDSGGMYERWATEYGVAYMIPSVLGQTRVVLCDPRAIAHFYARETWTYVQTSLSLAFLETSVCSRHLTCLVCLLYSVRLVEGYYGLRVKTTGGTVELLSLR
jgi:hypothetical protein